MPDKNLATELPVPTQFIERRIYLIRGQKVMLDTHLAELYQVPTFRLHEAVKRNLDRFPEDSMFQLTAEETQSLTSQIAMSKPAGRGGRRTLPYAFTEHGVATPTLHRCVIEPPTASLCIAKPGFAKFRPQEWTNRARPLYCPQKRIFISTPMTVTVKNNTPLSVPAQLQRRAGFKPGHRVEFKVSGGIINIIPELPSADDEYTPAQRRAIDAQLKEARRGPYYGPFNTAKEMIARMKGQLRKRAAASFRLPLC